MKNYFYLFIGTLTINSCVKIQDSRPATTLTTPLPAVPVYVAPVCTPPLNESISDNSAFNLKFPVSGSVHTAKVSGETLSLEIINGYDEMVKVTMYPFVPKQSTVYKCKGSKMNLSSYESFIAIYTYGFDPFNLYVGESVETLTKNLHLKYDSSTDTYEITFCDNTFIIERTVGNTAIISGRFKFKL